MICINVRLPEKIIAEIDKQVKNGFYSCRSDYVRDKLRVIEQ